MALEISEIAVRLAVGTPGAAPGGGGAAGGSGRAGAGSCGADATDGQPAAMAPQQYEDLVRACVQDVLASLRMSGER
ncbi:hypothetical protein [Azospirillum largimobile]